MGRHWGAFSLPTGFWDHPQGCQSKVMPKPQSDPACFGKLSIMPLEQPLVQLHIGQFSPPRVGLPTSLSPVCCLGLAADMGSAASSMSVNRTRSFRKCSLMLHGAPLGSFFAPHRILRVIPKNGPAHSLDKRKEDRFFDPLGLERKTRLELATPTLARLCSTN